MCSGPETDGNMDLAFPAPECEKMGRCKEESAMRVVIHSIPESEPRKKRKRSRKCVISMGDEHPSWDSVEQWNGAMSNDAADDS
jgi:hypothetical protein